MALETGVTYIDDLVQTNPVGATDDVAEGDDHIRNIKIAVQGSFPSLGSAAVTKTAAEINDLVEKTDPVLNGTITGTAFLDEDTMSSDSAVVAASQQSIKAYVDNKIVILDVPELLLSTLTPATTATAINSTTLNTAAATAAIVHANIRCTSNAWGQFYGKFYCASSAFTADNKYLKSNADLVIDIASANPPQPYVSDFTEFTVNLDVNHDLWYLTTATSSSVVYVDLYLVGYHV